MHEQGLVRAVGTSNFKPAHLERLLAETGELPDVNQVQLSPDVARPAARAYHAEHGIVTQSWSPIGGRSNDVLAAPAVTGIAERLGRTPGQVVLRWHVQLDLVPIPKSSDPQRLADNLDVFSFELSQADMDTLSGLDRGESAGADSDAFGH